MSTDFVISMRASAPAPIIERTKLVFLGKLLLLLVATGLWVAIQCVYVGALPSEVQQAIAGP